MLQVSLSLKARLSLVLLSFFMMTIAISTDRAVAQVDEEPVPDVDVLISFHEPPGPEDLEFISLLDGTVTKTFSIVPAVAATLPADSLDLLADSPRVDQVEVDGTFEIVEQQTPWGISKIQSDIANLTVTGAGVVVAVIDTGVDLDHPDLAANLFVNMAEATGEPNVDDDGNGYIDDIQGWDFVNNDNDPDDDNSHGTHCAGTIAALDNDIGVVGVAPDATILPIKVLAGNGSGSFSDVISAVEYCTTLGVHVTSNSYGSSGNPGSIVQQAFDNANALGILNVAAAGNSGSAGTSGSTVIYPARYDNVVAVGSTRSNDARSGFSSTGPEVELAAPGSGILSTIPGGGYGNKSGTSMACPHAAGAAALLIEAGVTLGNGNPLTNDEARLLLQETSVDLGDAGRDNDFGFGRIDTVAAIAAMSSEAYVNQLEYRLTQKGHLRIRLYIKEFGTDDFIPTAKTSVDVYLDGNLYATFSRNSNKKKGIAAFTIRDAPSGTWSTVVTNVEKESYFWDGSEDAQDPGFSN